MSTTFNLRTEGGCPPCARRIRCGDSYRQGQDEGWKYCKLVYAENKSYGFERNLLAMRNMGRAVATTAAIIVGALLASEVWVGLIWNSLNLIIAIVILLMLVAFWQFLPSEPRVHQAGNIYAEALIDSIANV